MPEFSSETIHLFSIFVGVGFLAQLVDGALGMAYGVVSTSVLLAFGVPPATASASVHAAEVFTTGASGISHIAHKNVDWKMFWMLAPAGAFGGAIGAYFLTGVDGHAIRPFIVGYLGLMGAYILFRAFRPWPHKPVSVKCAPPLGVIGGFLDAVGGGGWGPTVTSSLIGAGGAARYVIGTVNTAEFFVTSAISGSFVYALVSGHWREADGLINHAIPVAGLIVGGVFAAPVAAFVVRFAPTRVLTMIVGCLILAITAYQGWRLWG